MPSVAAFQQQVGLADALPPDAAGGNVNFVRRGGHLGTQTATAVTETALQLDGSSGYGLLPSSVKFTSGSFTISLWFDPTTNSQYQFLFMRGFAYGDQQGDIGLKINPNSGDLDFQAKTSDGQWLFGWDAPESALNAPFNLNQWNDVRRDAGR